MNIIKCDPFQAVLVLNYHKIELQYEKINNIPEDNNKYFKLCYIRIQNQFIKF